MSELALVAVDAEGEIVSTPGKRKPGRPKGSGGRSVRKVTGRVRLAKETTLALTHKLLRGSADTIVAKIIAKALDDSSPIQKDMLKLCFDRIAPIAAFERANAGQMNRVEVVVTLAADSPTSAGVRPVEGGPEMAGSADVIDVEAKVVEPKRDNQTDEEADEGGEQASGA